MKNLKRIRKEKGMTQMDLSIRAGCVQSLISEYEHGYKSPTFRSLKPIADALGVHVADLFDPEEGRSLHSLELIDTLDDCLERDIHNEKDRQLVRQMLEMISTMIQPRPKEE